jgi:hypothetical protein
VYRDPTYRYSDIPAAEPNNAAISLADTIPSSPSKAVSVAVSGGRKSRLPKDVAEKLLKEVSVLNLTGLSRAHPAILESCIIFRSSWSLSETEISVAP